MSDLPTSLPPPVALALPAHHLLPARRLASSLPVAFASSARPRFSPPVALASHTRRPRFPRPSCTASSPPTTLASRVAIAASPSRRPRFPPPVDLAFPLPSTSLSPSRRPRFPPSVGLAFPLPSPSLSPSRRPRFPSPSLAESTSPLPPVAASTLFSFPPLTSSSSVPSSSPSLPSSVAHAHSPPSRRRPGFPPRRLLYPSQCPGLPPLFFPTQSFTLTHFVVFPPVHSLSPCPPSSPCSLRARLRASSRRPPALSHSPRLPTHPSS
ncbi:unnamed protein product [Closterium sp. Naga37s-1]|nr:unnamed protein product [Closterium sp. Naga37s-1]